MKREFLPVNAEEVAQRGWDRVDFVLVTGDAYVDHPSFGTSIISRVLESRGYRVGILAQPDWRDEKNFKVFGRPRLGFLVNSGNIDSMVNHYTASKKLRSDDAYTPGGKSGARPDRAVIVYCNCIRRAFKKMPIIIGGIEASLRRFAHYDYWDDAIRRSILLDTGANLLIYGMGERAIVQVADAMNSGVHIDDINDIPGTAFLREDISGFEGYETLPDVDEIRTDKDAYNRAFMAQQAQSCSHLSKRLVQHHGGKALVVNPPQKPLTRGEMDAVYALPYARAQHPSYKKHIPALDEVEFSITSCRGCFGGCSFCALTFHQGRTVTSRSHGSIISEAVEMTRNPNFKGYIHDVGGPTANFREPACSKQTISGACTHRQCLSPKCPSLNVSHSDYKALLQKLREIKGVKKVFIRSGLRYDYILYDKDNSFMIDLIEHHISGQLKIAPEHISPTVLEMMGKPDVELYERFLQKYKKLNETLGKDQYVVPYFMSSHPGSDMNCAIELALYMKERGIRPEQVQDFYPTPGTLSTAMYYTGMDPRTSRPVYIPASHNEKRLQRALLQYYRPQNAALVRQALKSADREDLIGHSKKCLVRPESMPDKNRRGRK